MTAAPRWDGDRRGSGVANGAWIAADVAEVQAALENRTRLRSPRKTISCRTTDRPSASPVDSRRFWSTFMATGS